MSLKSTEAAVEEARNAKTCTGCGKTLRANMFAVGSDYCNLCRIKARAAQVTEEDVQKNRILMEDAEREATKLKEEVRAATTSASQAEQQLLARRELARRRLLPFVMHMTPGYKPGWVHAEICIELENFLEAVKRGESPRLAIFMPPRHGKSELASRNFPAYALGHCPWFEVIQTSYSADLSLDFSRKVRETVGSTEYGTLFPGTAIKKGSSAAEKWDLARTSSHKGKGVGSYTAVGAGGPITGRGMHIGIIDDPVKNRQEAQSETVRASLKSWYSSTFYTRLAPGAGILLIMTRWHEDDLGGYVLDEFKKAEREAAETGTFPDDADRWRVVKYPAIAEVDEKYRKAGEALHPERYPLKSLKRIKRTLLEVDWEALYQQNPTIADGDMFKASDYREYDPSDCPPLEDMRVFATWDFAISLKTSADWTVGVVFGVHRNTMYVLHIFRGRWSSLEIVNKIIEAQVTYSPELQGFEKGVLWMTLAPILDLAAEEQDIEIEYHELEHGGQDKRTRAVSFAVLYEKGLVKFPRDDEACLHAKSELLAYPNGRNDDCFDALSWAGRMIDMFIGVTNITEGTQAVSDTRRSRGVVKRWRDKLAGVAKKVAGRLNPNTA